MPDRINRSVLALASIAIASLTAAVAAAGTPGTTYGPGGGFPIPDNNPAGAGSTIVITDSGTINDLNLNLNGLSHSWMGDLVITLTHEDTNTTAVISNRAGVDEGGDPNFGFDIDLGGDYAIDDEATAGSFHDQIAFNQGSLPAGDYNSFEALSVFDGLDIAGTWTLFISDNAGGDTGALGSWSLLIETPDGPICNTANLFGPDQQLATGVRPTSVAIGDLNGDGVSDLAVANENSATVSVLLSNGNGTFQPRLDFATGGLPLSVAIGDLDGDGNPDLAMANFLVDTATVLLGNGDGTFMPSQNYSTGTRPSALAIGDLNDDGNPDLVTANSSSTSNTVSVLVGNGNGTFQPRQDYATGSSPRSVAIGDLNGDGTPDIAVANRDSDSVSVLLGNGDGTFQPRQNYATGSSPRSVAIGDLNGDGNRDIAVANTNSNSVSVLLGNGDGTVQPRQNYAVGDAPFFVSIGDLDGDGAPDLAVANRVDNSVSVLPGSGTGAFPVRFDFATGNVPLVVAIGDLDDNGTPDLATANTDSATVSVLLNQCEFAAGFAIPDGDPAGISSSLVITRDGTITDLDLRLTAINHTWLGDLVITLTHENTNTTVVIADRAGRNEDGDPNFGFDIDLGGNYIIDDESLSGSFHDQLPLNGGLLPPGDYNSFEALSAFDGLSITGTWTLFISDSVTPDAGTLGSWSLFAETTDTPPCPADVTGDKLVNLADLNLILANFGQTTTEGDTDNDGQVNLADLNAVLAGFGQACP